MGSTNKVQPMMSIGAVSRATGVPANTIRTWERRYGFPEAERTAGGHREYAASVVPHIGLVQEALAKGHRPRQVPKLSFDALRDLLGLSAGGHTAGRVSLLDATRALDAPALEQGFAWPARSPSSPPSRPTRRLCSRRRKPSGCPSSG